MATRLKDIANDLGLSVVTISKVLRDHPDIAAETRRRVLKRMRELNYQPNFAARSLVTGRTWTLGLVVPDLLHPFFADIAKAISVEARKHGYSLLISSSDEDPELEVQEIKQLLARRVDVIMVASAQWSVDCFRMIEEHKTPYILIDRRFQGLDANFVGVDDEAVGSLATSHLIEQGCRAYCPYSRSGSQHCNWPPRRLQASACVLQSHAPCRVTLFLWERREIIAEKKVAMKRLRNCLPHNHCPMASSALMIRRHLEPCAQFSKRDCAYLKISRSSDAAISPIRISCVFLCLPSIKEVRT